MPTPLAVNHMFMNFRRLHVLDMTIRPNDCLHNSALPDDGPVRLATCSCLYTGVCVCGPVSSVGIATELRAGRSGIESRWGRDLPSVRIGPGAHPATCKMSTGSFPGVKCGRGVLLTTHPLLVPRSWESRAIPVPTPWATPGL